MTQVSPTQVTWIALLVWFAASLSLCSGLKAFKQEGIQNITALKDQLVAANHVKTESIVKRHQDVNDRWERLQNASDVRKQRLNLMMEQYRRVEDLYLTFAKKASAFNSWFENAEEDLTDPVRCNSIEEIRALRDAHAQFQVGPSTTDNPHSYVLAI